MMMDRCESKPGDLAKCCENGNAANSTINATNSANNEKSFWWKASCLVLCVVAAAGAARHAQLSSCADPIVLTDESGGRTETLANPEAQATHHEDNSSLVAELLQVELTKLRSEHEDLKHKLEEVFELVEESTHHMPLRDAEVITSGGDVLPMQQMVPTMRSLNQKKMRGQRHLQGEHHNHDPSMVLQWECPPAADPTATYEVPHSIMATPGAILKLAVPRSSNLCHLRVQASIETRYLARSYTGHDWEAYSNRDRQDATNIHRHHYVDSIVCNNDNCVMSIGFAMPDDHNHTAFPCVLMLETVTRAALSNSDQAARFLEQTTFGTTKADLTSLTSSSSSLSTAMAEWVRDQQTTVPLTSHREYFRRRLNARFGGSHRGGHATHPCHEGTWYRRAALWDKDRRGSLTVETHPDDASKIMVSVDGELRTIVPGPLRPVYNDDLSFPDGTYDFCYLLDGDFVGSDVEVTSPIDGKCRSVQFAEVEGNPPVILEDAPERLVQLDTFVTPISEATHPNLLYVETSFSGAVCDSITRTYGDMPIVFGLYNGEYYIHDPRFIMEDNTLENPLTDGGGAWVHKTADAVNEPERILCSNVPRSVFNEDKCVLSTATNTCTTLDPLQAAMAHVTNKAVVVCGSEGEVANDLSLPLTEGKYDMKTSTSDTIGEFVADEQQKLVWFAVVLWSQDQLRQRVAWALSQIFAVTPNSVRKELTENNLAFYDIFVRHAFGNFRDIIREVSYSPEMADFLSYFGSRSTAYEWNRDPKHIVFPDENYAREIMQLFVLGLYKLNDDGTVDRDENGAMRLYSNDDIMEYSRVWTGFNDYPVPRGNMEEAYLKNHGPRIDPLIIEKDKRDRFPKMGLDGKYIGDGYPLCTDLPSQHFLKKGATFRVLGSNPNPELQYEPASWISATNRVTFKADPSGGANSLYAKLCIPENPSDMTSTCTYKGMVTLEENLSCHGMECNVDTITNVEVGPGIFYEYVRPPCVHLAYYQNPEKIEQHHWANRWYMCANPLEEYASTVCCKSGSWRAYLTEKYWGENVRRQTAKDRCTARGDDHNRLCNQISFSIQNCGDLVQCANKAFYWVDHKNPCTLQVKVDKNGKAAIVHDVDDSSNKHIKHVQEANPTYFRVHWTGDVQNVIDTCGTVSGCTVATDGSCLCDVITTEEAAFDYMPSSSEVMSLTIGAFDPEVQFDGSFTSWTEGDVTAYRKTGQSDLYSTETIFEVKDEYGRTQRRRNFISTATLPSGYAASFRTPVHFLSLTQGNGDIRDSMHETEAALDHYFYHKNTAPFLALRLAQRFGISNPSPRYISAIADAFKSGTYEYVTETGTISYGGSVYGDMGATVAAVILDREARTPVLDADQLHGSIREPFLKVVGLMRSMEFQAFERPFPRFAESVLGIGQMVHEIFDVFSFFNPYHQPDGAISELGLLSPEADVHVTPNIVNMINGMASLIKYGFDHCFGGFGMGDTFNCNNVKVGVTNDGSTGELTYEPTSQTAAAAVDELATILTSGRLSSAQKSTILNTVGQEQDINQVVVKAQQMIVATPEFHTTGLAVTSPYDPASSSSSSTTSSSTLKPYKAVVQVHLHGGVDSFNVLVPHDGCTTDSSGTFFDQQYRVQRGNIAIRDDERNFLINVGQDQPCTRFVINENIPLLHELYNDGDLAFFFNTGVLNKPSTKDNYEMNTLTQLFAHNTMRSEIARLDPYDSQARSGVMGRMASVLSEEEYGYSPQMLAIDRASTVLTGGPSMPFVVSQEGPIKLLEKTPSETFDLKDVIPNLNSLNEESSSVFARAWSDRLLAAMSEAEELCDALDGATVETFAFDDAPKFGMVTKWLQTRETRGADRDMIYVEVDGWDHHDDLRKRLSGSLEDLNDQLTKFVTEVKDLGLWDDVTLVVTSDFGRTITPNSGGGSDHGWGGHTFVLGGGVKGGQVFGEYPDIGPSAPLNLGRGRVIPTLSWESLWNPIVEWIGVSPVNGDYSARDRILPNAVTTGTTLFGGLEVFESVSSPPGDAPSSFPSPQPSEAVVVPATDEPSDAPSMEPTTSSSSMVPSTGPTETPEEEETLESS